MCKVVLFSSDSWHKQKPINSANEPENEERYGKGPGRTFAARVDVLALKVRIDKRLFAV